MKNYYAKLLTTTSLVMASSITSQASAGLEEISLRQDYEYKRAQLPDLEMPAPVMPATQRFNELKNGFHRPRAEATAAPAQRGIRDIMHDARAVIVGGLNYFMNSFGRLRMQ
jgi:hypothetical protein